MNILSLIFSSIFYQPMLNFLVWVYIYTNNFGVAVIVLTLLVRLAINPLNAKALESQKVMAEIQPRLNEIQKKYKDDKEKQAAEMMNLYKEKKFNPFSGMLFLFIQIPIIWALFYIFKAGVAIDGSMMYSFISFPAHINPYFLGIDLSAPNIYLAVVTAVAQFFQAKTAIPPAPKADGNKKDQMTQVSEMMGKQMLVFLPVITFFVLFKLPAALGLYWLITTVFTVVQQHYIFKKKGP